MQAGKRKPVTALVAVLLAAAAAAGPAAAGPSELVSTTSDDEFAPRALAAGVGDEVSWETGGALQEPHNVLQDQGLFTSGPPAPTLAYGPITPSAGTYRYFCEVHGDRASNEGMFGRLRIAPVQTGSPAGTIGVQWSTGSGDSGDRFEVRWEGPGTGGKYEPWIERTRRDDGVFGEDGDPVNVHPSHAYSFQARSFNASKPDKRSRWSPSLEVEAP